MAGGDVPSEGVEGFADRAGDGDAFVVVKEWREEQEASFGTGTETLSAGFGHGMKAIVEKDDEGQAGIENGTGNLLFTRTDGR